MLAAVCLTLVLGIIAWLAAQSTTLQFAMGGILPLLAVLICLVGIILRVIRWAKTPVPFAVPVTGGQERSMDWVKPARFDSPYTKGATVVRMALEILTFRALFRNARTVVRPQDERAVFYSSKWLWVAALLFHYSFLVVCLRHLRLFLNPVPWCMEQLELLDGLMQIGVPRLYVSGAVLLGAVLFLLIRRLVLPRIRYISLLNDYFPLCLLLAVAGSGIWMRYFGKVDIATVKELTMSLAHLSPALPANPIGPWFFVHLFFVSLLLIYIPFSKIMHFGGIFLSPTLNTPNNTRAVRHVNPWGTAPVYRTYADYEDEFRERMEEVDIPVETPSTATAE